MNKETLIKMDTIITLKNNATQETIEYTFDPTHKVQSFQHLCLLCQNHKIIACTGEDKIAVFFQDEIKQRELDHAQGKHHRMNILKLSALLK